MSEFAEGLALGQSNNSSWGNNGGELIWLIVLLAALGWGGNGSFGNGGNQMGYDLGKVATTNDVASGFSTSTIMGNQREIQNMLYNMQNFVNQGFAGLNQTITQVGYDNRFAVADLGYKLQDCCCKTQHAIQEVNYNMERNKSDMLNAFSTGIQRIIDLDTCRQLREQERYINTLERRASNLDLVNMLGRNNNCNNNCW